MKSGDIEIKEMYGDSSARMICPPELIPNPGQYLLAHMRGADSPLAIPLFPAESTPDGFRSAPAVPSAWMPGATLSVRGPMGRGFAIPPAARRIALIAFDDSPARLRGLLPLAFKQNAEAVLLCDSSAYDFPESVEIQPTRALPDILKWADYIAADILREHWDLFKAAVSAFALPETQVLFRAPMPCGALAECGACALVVGSHWKMICKEGPVFRMDELCAK